MKHFENFYTKPENISDTEVEIRGAELKHLSRVLRKNIRDIVNVVDGTGNLYTVVLTEIKKDYARGEIQKRVRFAGEQNFLLTLAQAVPKGNRFDLVVEKGTELGVSAFLPLNCAHSVIETSPARISRWRNIALAAMKQSGRSVLPEIHSPQSVKEIVQNTNLLTLRLIAHSEGKTSALSQLAEKIKQTNQLPKSAIVLVGPEGGFTTDEVNFALDNGFKAFTMGNRRLRSETAGIVAAALTMELIGSLY